ncbi:MAG: ATP synthase F1 subunit delta [Bryobacteraceae bacterium]
MLSVAASRYARALVEVVTAPGSRIDGARVLTELRAVEAAITGSTALHNALLSPAIPPARKRAVMARLMPPSVITQVRNFVFVVIDHRRIHEFSSIVEGFELFLDEKLGYIRADVSSAQALTETQRADLGAQLSRLSGKMAKLRYATDPMLLAGVVARVGSTVYDGSVRGQLERMRAKLASGY